MSGALKPCPFCGSEVTLPDGYASVVLLCPKCGECGPEADDVVKAWNTRHDAMALDFGPECTDEQSSAEDQRARSLYKATRRLIGALPHERLGEHALRAFRDVRRILREVDHPDDGVKAERVQVLQIERGGSGL